MLNIKLSGYCKRDERFAADEKKEKEKKKTLFKRSTFGFTMCTFL